MAKKDTSEKEPGRLKQMWNVFEMTRRYDSRAVWYIAAAVIVPILVGIAIGLLLPGSILTLVLWIVVGIMGGVLAGMMVLGRRAESAAYSQIRGKPGAVGAVLRSTMRRGWVGSEEPVAANPKTKDAVYTAVGRAGVVVVGEGPKTRTKRLVDEERRTIAKAISGSAVPVTVFHVGPDEDAVPLEKLVKRMGKLKRAITKAEVLAVSNRLTALRANRRLPIPKGIDPTKVRPQRGR